MSQWCWAASIAMVFQFYGYEVPQQRIVQETFGAVVNMPAGSGRVLTQALNRPWVDTAGRPFTVRAVVYDRTSGQAGVNNDGVVEELKHGRPLIVGTQGHAMVVTAIQYLKAPWGVGQVIGVTVQDPWPGRGQRQLTWPELVPTYVAVIHVRSVSSSERRRDTRW
jgi:hypothetical protein